MKKVFIERIQKFQNRLIRSILGDPIALDAVCYWSQEPLPFVERER